MSEEIDTFEKLFEAQREPDRAYPDNGRQDFEVKGCSFYEDSQKVSFLLKGHDGTSLFKKLYMSNEEKAYTNKQWLEVLFDEAPSGGFADFDWSQCDGKIISVEIGRFTPEDKDEEIVFAYKPKKAVERAVKKKATRKAEKKHEVDQNPDDIPF